MTPLSFRLADLDDVHVLLALVEAAYRGAPTASTWTTEAELLGGQRVDRQMMSEAIDDADTRVIVAVAAERVSGPTAEATHATRATGATDAAEAADTTDAAEVIVACCEVRTPDVAGNSVLGMFAVDPDLQGTGLGRHVLAAGEREAATLGATGVELHVLDVRHELLAWYDRRGYVTTDEQVPFPYGDERFGEPKRNDLRFAVLRKPLGTDG